MYYGHNFTVKMSFWGNLQVWR